MINISMTFDPEVREYDDDVELCLDCGTALVTDIEADETGHVYTIVTCPGCGYSETETA